MNIFAKNKIKQSLTQKTGSTLAETLANKVSTVVDLPWNGELIPFEIHEINFMELMQCGKFPNLLVTYLKPFDDGKDEKKDEITKEQALVIKAEQDSFLHELARKSMVEPSYTEAFEAIKKRLPAYEEGDEVIPKDFLLGLYGWYLRRFNEALKKNLKVSS